MTSPEELNRLADAIDPRVRYKNSGHVNADIPVWAPVCLSADLIAAASALRQAATHRASGGEDLRDAICEGVLGVKYDTLYRDKQAWTKDRGARGDVNGPFQVDVDEGVARVLALDDPGARGG